MAECCIPLIIYVCILVVSSLCCFRLGPLHHWSPPPALQRQASGSSVPHPRRNLLPPAAWRVPLSCVSPAERERRCNLFPRFWIVILLYQIHGDLHDCKKNTEQQQYSLTFTESDWGSSSSSSLSSSSLKYTSTPLSLSSVFDFSVFFVFFFFFGTWDSACSWQIINI